MTAHDATPTPGPWIADKAVDYDEDGGGSEVYTGEFYVDNGDGTVSYIDRWNPANATLIASAPALAEENARLRQILGACVAFIEDALTGLSHPRHGPFRTGVTDLEITKDGSIMLSDARAVLAQKEPEA